MFIRVQREKSTTYVNLAAATFIERSTDSASIAMPGSFAAIVVHDPAELAAIDLFLRGRTLNRAKRSPRTMRLSTGGRR